jgi:uncharacterized protein YciW
MTLDSVIPRVAGVVAGSRAAGVLGDRERVLELSQNSHAALLSPSEPGGLSHPLRAALATRVATVNADEALAAHYRALLDANGAPSAVLAIADPAHAPTPEADRWLAAVVAHTDLLTVAPQNSTKATIQALGQAGVDDADVVRLTQLVGFVVYQVRFAAGLRLIAEQQE